MAKGQRKWTAEELDQVREGVKNKQTIEDLMKLLNRSESSIIHSLDTLGLRYSICRNERTSGAKWTSGELQILHEMSADGSTYFEIAETLGRSERAIIGKMWKLGLQPRQIIEEAKVDEPDDASSKVKLRKCLGCSKQFMSEGPWNRRCIPCKSLEVYRSA